MNGSFKNNSNELNDYRIRYNKIENQLSEYKTIQIKLRDLENRIGLMTQ